MRPIFCLLILLILGEGLADDYQEFITYNLEKNVCLMPVNYGKCRAAVYSWYYNFDRKRCQRFVYHLCGGNANRFYSRAECEELCLKFAHEKRIA